MLTVLGFSWASTPTRMLTTFLVTIGFAVLARVLRGVSRSGMFAGGAACFLLYSGVGPAAFATLVALFVLTWLTTRLGHRRKQELGLAERGDGRNARQVLANLAIASAASAGFGMTGDTAWRLVLTAALAEAATDTVASEIGQSSGRTTLLITTWKMVPAGTDGGVTLAGTLAGIAAGIAIAAIAAATGFISSAQVWVPATAGLAGMLADSVLGATIQRRGWINNELVNLFGTLAAGLVGWYSA